MSQRLAFALVLVGLAAACTPRQPEPVITTTAPVVMGEQVFTGKYGN